MGGEKCFPIIGIFFITAQTLFGYHFSQVFLPKLKLVCVSVAFPIGEAISTLIFLLFSALFGLTKFHILINSVLFLILAFFASKIQKRNKKSQKEVLTNRSIIEISGCLLVSYFFIGNYYFKEENAVNYQISYKVSSEIAFINSFIYGINSQKAFFNKIEDVFCLKCIKRTKYLQSYHSAILIVSGFSLKASICIPSVIAVASSFYAFLLFAKTVFGNRKQNLCYFSLFLLFNTGGFGFINYFFFYRRINPMIDFVFNTGSCTTLWHHPIINFIIANRESQISFCLAITVMNLLFMHPNSLSTAFIGVIVGVLPSYQFETFFGVLLFVIFYFIATKSKITKNFFIGMFSACLYPFILLKPFSGSKLIKIIAKEMFYNEKMGIFSFLMNWIESLGVFFILSLFSFISLNKEQFLFYKISFFLFVFCSLFDFRNNEISNILMPTWASFQSIFIVSMLNNLYNFASHKKDQIEEEEITKDEKGVLIGIVFFLYIIMTISSFTGFVYNIGHDVPLWGEKEEIISLFIKENVDPQSVFAVPEIIGNDKHYSKEKWSIIKYSNRFINPALLLGMKCLKTNNILLYFNDYEPAENEKEFLSLDKISSADYLITLKDDPINQSELSNRTWKQVNAFQEYSLFKKI